MHVNDLECQLFSNHCGCAISSDLKVVSQVLVHYDPDSPIRVAADASSYSLGAVLSHVQDHKALILVKRLRII